MPRQFASGQAIGAGVALAEEVLMNSYVGSRLSIRAALACTGAALLLLSACASEPFAYLDGKRWSRVEMNTYDVTVISVDGTHYLQRPARIDPGPRQIVVQGPPTAGFNFGEQRTLALNVEPCTYYWIGARKAGPLSQDFEPYVNYQEPIAGCRTAPAK